MVNHTFNEHDIIDQEEDERDYQDVVWTSIDDNLKEKLFRAKHEGTIDLSEVKRDKIRGLLFRHNNIKVYEFIIRITLYHGEPTKVGGDLTVDVEVYHETHNTPASGIPHKAIKLLDICRDDRFCNASWISYFDVCIGKRIPTEVLIDIIRHMQVVKRLPAFL